MRKIISTLAVLAITSVSIMADTSVDIFDNKDNTQIGGLVGKNVVFMYPNNGMAKITSLKELKMMAKSLEKNACKDDEGTADLIKKGHRVIFLYPGKEKTSIFTIDSCD